MKASSNNHVFCVQLRYNRAMPSKHHPRIRSPLNSQAIAEWMFDCGYGYVDEPQFVLFDTHFYACDFLPGRKDILRRKVDEASAFRDISRKQKDYNSAFLFPAFETGDGLFDPIQIQQFTLDCTNHAQQGMNDDRATFEASSDLLNRIADHQHCLFSEKTLQETTKKQPSRRMSFVRMMKAAPEPLLEYAARKELPFCLSTSKVHPLFGDRPNTHGANIGIIVKEHPDDSKPLKFTRQIYVAGIQKDDPKQSALIVTHEIGHCIASDPLNESPLNKSQLAHFRSKLRPVLNALEQLKRQGEGRQGHLLLAQDQTDFIAPIGSLYDTFDYHEATYQTDDSKTAEAFCNVLGLAYTYFAQPEMRDKLKTHYEDFYPDIEGFGDNLLALVDCTKTIFEQKLRELRKTNDLPSSLKARAGNGIF